MKIQHADHTASRSHGAKGDGHLYHTLCIVRASLRPLAALTAFTASNPGQAHRVRGYILFTWRPKTVANQPLMGLRLYESGAKSASCDATSTADLVTNHMRCACVTSSGESATTLRDIRRHLGLSAEQGEKGEGRESH